jgi:hypothetical protein
VNDQTDAPRPLSFPLPQLPAAGANTRAVRQKQVNLGYRSLSAYITGFARGALRRLPKGSAQKAVTLLTWVIVCYKLAIKE